MNINEYIKSALEKGVTPENLANEFTHALNRAETEWRLAQRDKQEREDMIANALDQLNASIDTGTLDFGDAAGVAGIFALSEGTIPINEIHAFTVEVLGSIREIYNKRANKRKEKAEPAGTGCKCGRQDGGCHSTKVKSDREILEEFLKNLL